MGLQASCRVPAFLAAYPKARLEVLADKSFVDVLAAGCAAGIRHDERLEPRMIAVPIGPREQRSATAPAPAYLDRRGRARHPTHASRLRQYAPAPRLLPPPCPRVPRADNNAARPLLAAFATEALAAEEVTLAERGWYDLEAPEPVVLSTGANGSRLVPIRGGRCRST